MLEKKIITWRSPCAHAYGYFYQSIKNLFPLKLFDEVGDKTPKSYHLFFVILTKPNTFQKNFSSYFISKVFHLPYFNLKQTHPKVERGRESASEVVFHVKWLLLLLYEIGTKTMKEKKRMMMKQAWICFHFWDDLDMFGPIDVWLLDLHKRRSKWFIYLFIYLFIIIIIEREGANEFRYAWLVRKERKY